MVFNKKNFFRFIARFIQKKWSLFFLPIAFLFTITIVVYPEEIVIPGDKKLEEGFSELRNKNRVEKELHLYVTDGYQEMADGELIYFWGIPMQRIF